MTPAPADVLSQIVLRTRVRVAKRRRTQPLASVIAEARTRQPRRPFGDALARSGPRVIAEFKRRSPSRGVLRADASAAAVAAAYEAAGAAALSVLTEPEYFDGRLEDLRQARAATRVPVLRKDFIVDPDQVHESWRAEADALLLIVAALSDGELAGLLALAQQLQIEVLVEAHDEDELRRALDAGARIVGVNSRDLRTLQVDLRTPERLAALIPDDIVAVAESGLRTPEDLRRLRAVGYDAFLVGEHLMSAPDPGAALSALVEGVP
jgi:indole-3-glycerol phosphate synthase